MGTTDPRVDEFIGKAKKWQEEYIELRRIILDCGLAEDYKWMHPCYTYDGKNVVLMHGFKEYCAILFPKGVLLKDPAGILIIQTENVQSARQVRFTNVEEIVELEPVLKAYVKEAVDIEKAGLKVKLKETSEYEVVEEFQNKLDEDLKLKQAFEGLTPGRQRAYLYYFAQAKQSKTRLARIEKHRQRILDGKGLND